MSELLSVAFATTPNSQRCLLFFQSNRRGRRARKQPAMGQCPCFGPSAAEQRRQEADRLESQDARAKAAEAAQRRQEQFDKSAAGRAARAQMKAMKQPNAASQGEPVLKWQMG